MSADDFDDVDPEAETRVLRRVGDEQIVDLGKGKVGRPADEVVPDTANDLGEEK